MAQTRLAVIDGLRGIAVLLVLWYHIWEISWLPAPLRSLQFIPETGFIGVDLFFFISGFVIVYPFVKAQALNEKPPTWGHFAYRRAIKIVPSYVLSIIVVVAIGYAKFSSADDAFRQLLTHLLFVHTWWPDTYGTVNGVLWTLAVEVNFYLAFPLLWWGFRRSPWLTAAAMTGISLLYRTHAQYCCLHSGQLENMIDNLPGYLDVFAAGMLAALLYIRGRDRWTSAGLQAAATATAIGGFAFLTVLLQHVWATRLVDQWSTVWAVENRTLVAVAFFAMGLGSLLAFPFWQRLVGNRILLFFAAISYNLYLYHQVLARELLRWRIPPFTASDPHMDTHWQHYYTLIAFFLTILQATIVTYAFERPLLRIPPARWREWMSRKGQSRALSR